MNRLIAILLVATLSAACAPTLANLTPAQADVWRQHATHIPVGAVVKVRTAPGERLRGVLIAVDDTGIQVNATTRIPEPVRRITFDQIAQLELAPPASTSLGRVAGVVAGATAAATLGVVLLLAAMWGD